MTGTRTNSFEQFLLLFDALTSAASDEPSRVATFFGKHQAITSATAQLFFFMKFGDFERRIYHSPKKYHPQAPAQFEKRFKDYKNRWEAEIHSVMYPGLFEHLGLEYDETDIEEARGRLIPRQEMPDPETDEHFDPLKHDGAAAFQMALDVADLYASNVGTEWENDHGYQAKIGLEAYDYLTETIGFDAKGVFRRWRAVPVIFMPAHVSNRHGLTERGSIYELIDDAVRAYVFGAPAAAIATCRAVLEIILKHHYNLDYQYRDKGGSTKDKGLKKLIVLASERYDFIHSARLKRLVDNANIIMHRYSQRAPLSDDDEKIILDFLKTIKYMAERAPAP